MATITSLLTAEKYADLPDHDGIRELIKGQVVEMAPPGSRHGQICFRTAYLLQRYLDEHDLGQILTNDSGVITERDPDSVRGADVAFYSYQRVPKGPMPSGIVAAAPELVFEVFSPSDRWSEMHLKVGEYLRAGVQIVCVVDDASKSIHVFYADKPSRVLSATDELTLPEILPEFRVSVARIFE